MSYSPQPLKALSFLLFALAVAGCSHGAGGGAAGGPGGRHKGPQPVTVQVTPVKLGTITQTQSITGSIAALEDSVVSARVSARVQAVYVREGDTVKAGQVIVQQDVSDLEANVNNAQAQVANAQAQVEQNQTNYDIEKNTANQSVANAVAALRAAQQNYSKEKEGNRQPQILASLSQVEQAKANEADAKITLQRDQYLYSQGALDAADLDTAQTTYTVDVQQYNNAYQSYLLTKEGNYAQDIASALEQVREAQTSVATQKANLAQVLLHQQEIAAAQASLQAAKATLAYDQEQVAYATVRAPFDGIIAARDAQPGQVASAGTALIEVVNVSTAYFQPTVSEEFFNEVHIGDAVRVRSEAVPGKTFIGHVAATFPSANSSTRVFSLRVDIPNPNNDLRPGMYARGELTTAVHKNVVVIPQSALMTQSQTGLAVTTSSTGDASGTTSMPDQQVMLAGPGNKAIAQPVTVGLVSGDNAEITSGLKPGDMLITTGAGLLQNGQAINIPGQSGQHHGRRALASSATS